MTLPALPVVEARPDGTYEIKVGSITIYVFSETHAFVVGAVSDNEGECSASLSPAGGSWHF